MFPAIVPNHPAPVNPPPRPLTVDEYLAALAAINASFTADCAALKARYQQQIDDLDADVYGSQEVAL